jgi:hypothetical protein
MKKKTNFFRTVTFKYNAAILRSDGQVNFFFNTLTPTPQPAYLIIICCFLKVFQKL